MRIYILSVYRFGFGGKLAALLLATLNRVTGIDPGSEAAEQSADVFVAHIEERLRRTGA